MDGVPLRAIISMFLVISEVVKIAGHELFRPLVAVPVSHACVSRETKVDSTRVSDAV